jgi:hypothetical protein
MGGGIQPQEVRLEVKLGQRFETMRTAADRVNAGPGSGDPGTFDTLRLADDATDSAEEGEGEAAGP